MRQRFLPNKTFNIKDTVTNMNELREYGYCYPFLQNLLENKLQTTRMTDETSMEELV